MIITIDGPAGSGKTTVARLVAERLGIVYFDTGAMYRTVTYQLLKDKVDWHDPEALKLALLNFQFSMNRIALEMHYFLGDEDVTKVIRSEAVTEKSAEVAALGPVRELIVALQRNFGKQGDAVFEGRDLGTVVFPQADLKIFLSASAQARSQRRYQELLQKQGQISATCSQEKILSQMQVRDQCDETRKISPLRQAEDAHLIDTSNLTIDEVVEMILKLA